MSIPKKIDREASLRVERTRWFLVTLLLGAISLASIWSSCDANRRAVSEIKVVWVKMYPSGTWDIEFYDEDRGMDFFPATIDYILRNWTIRRYSEIPHSIKSDYGYAYKIMSNKLQKNFKNTFHAVETAERISTCSNCVETRINVRTIDHYDSDKTTFKGKYPGSIYRTNIFIDMLKSKSGSELPSEKFIVPLTWRIKAKEEIKSRKLLKDNPIGIEILSYDLLRDVSQEK